MKKKIELRPSSCGLLMGITNQIIGRVLFRIIIILILHKTVTKIEYYNSIRYLPTTKIKTSPIQVFPKRDVFGNKKKKKKAPN